MSSLPNSAGGAASGNAGLVAVPKLANATNSAVRLLSQTELDESPQAPGTNRRWILALEFPEQQLLWTGLPYQEYVLLGKKVVGISVLAGNMLHVGVETADLAGIKRSAAEVAAERVRKLSQTPFAGDRWINLRSVLGDYDFSFPEQTELPAAPRLEGVGVTPRDITLRLRGANGVGATVTLNHELEVISASVNGVPRGIPTPKLFPETE